MNEIEKVVERAHEVMKTGQGMQTVSLPALREVMEHVVSTNDRSFGYKKHSDHTKSSTRGCVMGCLSG